MAPGYTGCPDCNDSGFIHLFDFDGPGLDDEDNCYCYCHHTNHGDGVMGWQECPRCALPSHEDRMREPGEGL